MRIVFLLATLMWLATMHSWRWPVRSMPRTCTSIGGMAACMFARRLSICMSIGPSVARCRHARMGTRATTRGQAAPATAEQARRQLADSSGELYDSLGRFKTADKWRHFLAVAPDEPLAPEQLYHINSAVAAKLKTVLENFDSAASR